MEMRDEGLGYPEICDKVKAAKDEMAKEEKKKQREAAKKSQGDN